MNIWFWLWLVTFIFFSFTWFRKQRFKLGMAVAIYYFVNDHNLPIPSRAHKRDYGYHQSEWDYCLVLKH